MRFLILIWSVIEFCLAICFVFSFVKKQSLLHPFLIHYLNFHIFYMLLFNSYTLHKLIEFE